MTLFIASDSNNTLFGATRCSSYLKSTLGFNKFNLTDARIIKKDCRIDDPRTIERQPGVIFK